MTVKRGDIYYADLSPVVGSEQGGIRPVLIVQNDVGNKYSPTVIAAAITQPKRQIQAAYSYRPSFARMWFIQRFSGTLEQVRTIDKKRLKEKMGKLDTASMSQIDQALSISFGLHGEDFAPTRFT